MPALPNVPQVIRIVAKQSQSSGDLDVVNRWFMEYSGAAPTDTLLNTFANAVATEWATNIAPLMHANGILTNVSVEDLTSATAAIGAAAVNVVGTRVGTVLSAAACAVVKQLIARRYRGGHPRLYFDAGVEADLLTRSTWTPAFVTAMTNGVNGFMNAVSADKWAGATSLVNVNVSYFQGFRNFTFPSGRTRPIPTLRAVPVVDLGQGFVASQKIGSQRRRNQQST